MMAPTGTFLFMACLLLSTAQTTNAFAPARVGLLRTRSWKPNVLNRKRQESSWTCAEQQQLSRLNDKQRRAYFTAISTTTSLCMYNLPPGKNNNNDDLGDVLKGAATLGLVIAFFASPLGGIVLGIFNSFLLLAILTPVVATVGISVWQYFNTITGNCPNCGAPVRVVKADSQGQAQPTICISCGSIIQANYENTGIDNITGRNTLDELSMNSPFGGGFGGNGLFDVFGGGPSTSTSTTRTTATTTVVEDKKKTKDKIRREATIIDVEADDDQPWQ